MNHGSLFSGIGGFDLAAEWMGWNNVMQCEIDPFCRKVLKHYWPYAKRYKDIRETDFTIWRGKIDILTGGFPCQPYSTAGKRLGKEDNRHLWPEMLRAVREISPRWVVGENVRGLLNWNRGLVFDEVQADLEAEGYEVLPFLVPACSVNAPHERYRIWFVAYSGHDGHSDTGFGEAGQKEGESEGEKDKRKRIRAKPDGVNVEGIASDTHSQQHKNRPQDGIGKDRKETGTGVDDRIERHRTHKGKDRSRRKGAHGPAAELFGRNGWSEFPTVSPVCSRNDGISDGLDGITFSKWRKESIKGFGNAVVPQVVYQFFKAIEEFELLTNK